MKSWLKTLLLLALPVIGIFIVYRIGAQFFVPPPQEVAFEEVGQLEQGTTTVKAVTAVPVGSAAYDFTLPDVQGKTVSLADHKGKVLVLVFWTIWNPAAQDQLAILESYYQNIKGRTDVTLVTINNQEDKNVVTSFVRRGDYQVPILLDEDGAVGEAYGIRSLPAFYFIDGDRKIQDRFVGVLSESEIQERLAKLGITN